MARYILSDLAKDDVDEITSYVHQDSPTAAKRVRSRLREEMARLAEFPGIGHARAEVPDPSLRFWRVYSYLIVYRVATKPLQVIRVLHGARDLNRIFGQP